MDRHEEMRSLCKPYWVISIWFVYLNWFDWVNCHSVPEAVLMHIRPSSNVIFPSSQLGADSICVCLIRSTLALRLSADTFQREGDGPWMLCSRKFVLCTSLILFKLIGANNVLTLCWQLEWKGCWVCGWISGELRVKLWFLVRHHEMTGFQLLGSCSQVLSSDLTVYIENVNRKKEWGRVWGGWRWKGRAHVVIEKNLVSCYPVNIENGEKLGVTLLSWLSAVT